MSLLFERDDVVGTKIVFENSHIPDPVLTLPELLEMTEDWHGGGRKRTTAIDPSRQNEVARKGVTCLMLSLWGPWLV